MFEIFPIFMKLSGKNQAIISSGSCLYSLLVAFFYLILYYSMLNYDNIELNFFQFVGFSEIITIFVWFFLIGFYFMDALLSNSLNIHKEVKEELLNGYGQDV
jgi:hypothetical protein